MESNLNTSSNSEGCRRRFCGMASRKWWISISIVVVMLSIVSVVLTIKTEDRLSEKIKVIVDVDTGVDDAMALFYLLRAEKYSKLENETNGLEILGITCVNGNTNLDNVAINVLKVLKIADRLDLPVYMGAKESILKTPYIEPYFGEDGLGDVPMVDPPSMDLIKPEHAVNAMIRMVNEHPGEITLLTLGPLTNIALAIRLDENFLKKVKKLIIMGGSIQGRGNMAPGVEFNFFVDPEANYIVLNGTEHPKDTVLLVPWETFEDMEITMDWRKNVLAKLDSPEIIFMNQIEHVENYENEGLWTFADPITSALALNETLIGKRNSFGITPITEGPTRGGIAVDYYEISNYENKIEIASEVDVEKYKESLLYHFS